ncbi:MAG TPA: HD domain-containing protein [Candidatus Paceibacterota bacterium]|nr:HD domain-containing protein [Candidatus Paceibacterota bacterium]
MRYTFPVEQAIRAASVLHAGQVRKGSVPYPYITHLFATAMIIADYTEDEHTIVSALLHETLHNTDYSREEMTDDFGPTVTHIVESITEPPLTSDDTRGRNEQRKEFFKQLKIAPDEALMVLAAGKIHTMRSIIEEYINDYTGFISEYGTQHDERIHYYQELSNALNRRLRNPILSEFNAVFAEYKNFIHDIKEQSETY